MLLAEALRKAVAAVRSLPRLIVVDAVDEDAAAFYLRYGFVEHPRIRSALPAYDVRASLDSSAGG
jgi:hypothetical protein